MNNKKSFPTEFSVRLRQARKEIKLTQQEAAEKGEVTVQSWRNYEAGRAEPKISTLLFFGENDISLSWLISGKGPKKLTEVAEADGSPASSAKGGIIEEWIQDVREKEGGDGRIVMELSIQVKEFREWYREKKRQGEIEEDTTPSKMVA